ncbi:AI-2E family transporter [Corynebacterium sp. S7]
MSHDDDEWDEIAAPVDDDHSDQIDRTIVVDSWLKGAATLSLRLLVIGIALFALWYVVRTFWGGVLPVILAIIVCTVLAPATTWMRKHGVPSAIAALISILIFFVGLGFLISLIAPDIASHSQVLYLQAVEGIQRLQLWAQGEPLNIDAADMESVVNDIASWLQAQAGTIAGGVFAGISTASSVIVTLGVVLVLTFFFLKDGHKFLPWLRNATGRRVGMHATELLTRAWSTLGGYVQTQAIVSFVDALFIGIGIAIVGVPMAFTLAVITFIAGFIPIVGAFTAGALAVIVALVSLGFTEAVIVLIIVIAVQQIEGNILQPILQSRAMNLHAVVILVSVSVGGGLFGLVGAFLAVPFAAMVAVVYRYLQDMTALQAGEKHADEIKFVTREGEIIGKIRENESRQQRQAWREDLDWEPERVPSSAKGTRDDDDATTDESAEKSQNDQDRVRKSLARTFDRLKRPKQ